MRRILIGSATVVDGSCRAATVSAADLHRYRRDADGAGRQMTAVGGLERFGQGQVLRVVARVLVAQVPNAILPQHRRDARPRCHGQCGAGVDQPILYPVLNEEYATKIARDWNVKASGVGYVTRFEVEKSFMDRYLVQQAGGQTILEYWIPAEDLEDFNRHIVGPIEVVAEYRWPVRSPARFGERRRPQRGMSGRFTQVHPAHRVLVVERRGSAVVARAGDARWSGCRSRTRVACGDGRRRGVRVCGAPRRAPPHDSSGAERARRPRPGC